MEGTQDMIELRGNNDVHRPAGFWMRFWAYTIDVIIVSCTNGILLLPFKFINDGAPITLGVWSLAGIVGTIVLYMYFVLMTKLYGQTLGKMIFGLKVIRQDDESLRWSDLFFREVIGRFIYRVVGILTLLYLVVAFDSKKLGVHDMIADTQVVHEE